MKVRLFGGPADGRDVEVASAAVRTVEVPTLDPSRPGISRGQYDRLGDIAVYRGLATDHPEAA